jgi:hypothetical protein
MLQMIAAAIVDRISRGKPPVHLMKVMAHSGIVGNEHADELAKKAGGGEGEGQEVQECPAPAATPLHDLFWPVYEEETEDGRMRQRHVQDLSKHLKRKVHQEQRLGYAKQDGIYTLLQKFWQQHSVERQDGTAWSTPGVDQQTLVTGGVSYSYLNGFSPLGCMLWPMNTPSWCKCTPMLRQPLPPVAQSTLPHPRRSAAAARNREPPAGPVAGPAGA